MRTGANRAHGGRPVVGAGEALSRQFGRACQVGGAQLGNGANVWEHVRERSNEMSSSEEVGAARDPDFASPDPSRKGKGKVTGGGGSEGESASQEQLRQGGDSANSAALSGKGKRKLHPEDYEDLETGDSTFVGSLADTRRQRRVASRSKRHRHPIDTGPGASSANTIDLPDSPIPTGDDRTSRRSARVRYERGPGAIPTDSTVAQAGGMLEAFGRKTEATDDHAASSVQAMVTRARRRDQRGHEKREDTPALEDESSTGRAPATILRSQLSLPEPIRRGHLRRGFSPSTSFVGTSFRIRGNPSLVNPSAATSGFSEAGYDISGIRSQDRRLRMPERAATGSGSGLVSRGSFPATTGLALERYRVRRPRRNHPTHLLGGATLEMAAEGSVTPDGTPVGQFASGAAHAPINLDDLESPRGHNVIELEDEPAESASQLAEDERMARQLQAEFNGQVPEATVESYDAQMARSLQAHENNRMRLVTHPLFPNFRDEYSRHRAFPNPRRHRDRGASWWRQVDRHGHGLGPPLADGAGSSVRFPLPSHLSVEMRLEVLAALESAFQDNIPISLRLAQVDRDFNENDYEMLLALDDNNRMNGASAERIQQLPVTVLQPTDISDEACAVCLEVPVVGDQIRRLPCMHSFHQQCIDKWLQAQAVCPVCKAQI